MILRSMLFVLFLTAAAQLSADVFMRVSGQTDERIRRAGGKQVYASPIRLNGRAGETTVFRMEDSPSELAQRLLFPPLAFGNVLCGRLERNGQSEQTLVLPGEGSCTIMTVRRPAGPALPEWPTEFPALGPAVPRFSAATDTTRAVCAVADTAEEPEAAFARLDADLKSQGWTALASAGGTALYGRGTTVCALLATRGADGRSRITVIQRHTIEP